MDTQKIGIYLKQLRKKHRFTQQEVADRLNISPQAISKWERCECLPDMAILPEVAHIYNVKIEDILNSGLSKDGSDTLKDLLSGLNNFIDDKLFAEILDIYESCDHLKDIEIPSDIFLFLNQEQKLALINIIFEKPDYDTIIDEILQYTNNLLRKTIMDNLLYNEDYNTLELFMPFLTKNLKTLLVKNLLEKGELAYLEDNITFLNKLHRDMIIDYIIENKLSFEVFEGFIPFFDNKQKDTVAIYIKEDSNESGKN